MLDQTDLALKHILRHRATFIEYLKLNGKKCRPMIVGVSGCQGSGKTTLTDKVAQTLRSKHSLNVVNFSLDDLYLPHEEQTKLAKSNPGNRLLQFRGQAGSHDLPLAKHIFTRLVANDNNEILIPVYDKSCFDGQGDRLNKSAWRSVHGPYDVVIFEGWSHGFKPLTKPELLRVYQNDTEQQQLAGHPLSHLEQLNTFLAEYERVIYPSMDIFIHLTVEDLKQVYAWRIEQEHHMKSTRGVGGLSDDAVRAFVDTYMPSYELYLSRLHTVGFFGYGLHGESHKSYEGASRKDGGYSGSGRHLRMVLDPNRKVTETQCIPEPESSGSVDSTVE